jgi:hypothetical protein
MERNPTNTGPENFTGTTTTDLQNPLTFPLCGFTQYYVLGTYGSLPPQNATGDVDETQGRAVVVLNFGSCPPPPIGTISVSALRETYLPGPCPGSQEALAASVVVTGPENFTGTTTTDLTNLLTFTVVPGQYSVTVTYDSLPPQNETINVSEGCWSVATINICSPTEPMYYLTNFKLTMTLDKTEYNLGEPINVTLTITNISHQTQDFYYYASSIDFYVYTGSNNACQWVFQWTNETFSIPQYVVDMPFSPGEKLIQSLVWPQTCNQPTGSEGTQVSPGTYYIVGLACSFGNASVETTPIQVIIKP